MFTGLALKFQHLCVANNNYEGQKSVDKWRLDAVLNPKTGVS